MKNPESKTAACVAEAAGKRNPKEARSLRSERPRGWRAIGNLKFSILNLKLPLLIALAFCVLPFALCLPVWAQYSIDWWTIDGGGGTRSNAQYSLTATLGQPDAGFMNGGNSALSGGFWLTKTSASPNLYQGTGEVPQAPGTVEEYKFVVGDGAGLGWKLPSSPGGGNQSFVLAGSAQILPGCDSSKLEL